MMVEEEKSGCQVSIADQVIDEAPSKNEASYSVSQSSSEREQPSGLILNGTPATKMNLMREEGKGGIEMSSDDQIIEEENQKQDSVVNLEELDDELGEMTKYRIARREEQLKPDWEDQRIADTTLHASVERFGKITTIQSDNDRAREPITATLSKEGQVYPSRVPPPL